MNTKKRKNKMKYLIIIASFVMVSCATVSEMPEIVSTTAIDFRPYTSKGFLITPTEYVGEYESIGILTSTFYPALTKVPSRYTTSEGTVITDISGKRWFLRAIDYKKALEEIYNQSVNMGANALMLFQLKIVVRTNSLIYLPGIEATGYAIKRK